MTNDVKELEAAIEAIVHDWHVPGAAVSVVKDQQVISCRGYGVRELGKLAPPDGDTIYGIGSNTKSFTAAGVGLLVDEGKLGWDDLVIKYLPDFALSDPAITGQITLRDVLCHRSGMGRSMRILYHKDFTNAEILHNLRYFNPVSPFRYDFGYNNFHYMIAGAVIEAVSGQSWPEFTTERIFKPLGMSRSFADLKSTLGQDNMSGAHANLDDSLLPHHARLFAPENVVDYDDVGNQPAGGINSTAADLTHWMRMLLADGKWEGQKILSPQVIAQMFTPSAVMLDPMNNLLGPIAAMNAGVHFYTYGLGWLVFDYKGYKVVMHGGQITGFNSAVVLVPEVGLGFSVLVSSHQTISHIPLVFKIMDFFLGGSQRDWNNEYLGAIQYIHQGELAAHQSLLDARKAGTSPSLPKEAYVGKFHNDFMGDTEVAVEGDTLTMAYGKGYAGDLVHWHDDTFYVRWSNRTFDHNFITFTINDGAVTAVEVQDEAVYQRI